MYKNYFEQESGRSMVEMLGVLAIIGVLSVGGISGYTTAMNKHKANEILNAAAVRAMVVSTQLQSGTDITDVSLGEFDNENNVGGATFAAGVTDAGNNRFTIGFANNGKPSDSVVEQMQNIAGTDGIVRDLTKSGLTYNNDLTADKIASDYKNENDCKTPYTWCAALKTCQNAGETCQCPANSSTTTTTEGPITNTACYCNSGYKLEGNECKSAGPTTPFAAGVVEPTTHYDLYKADGITPKDGICPTGYQWAQARDFDGIELSALFPWGSGYDGSLCADCNNDYWLRGCDYDIDYNLCDESNNSNGMLLNSGGYIYPYSRDETHNVVCIKSS